VGKRQLALSKEVIDPQSQSVLQFRQPALQLIYDTAPIGLAFLSPDCRYVHINQRLTEICGISIDGHLGRTVRECVPALASSVEEIVRSIMETGEPVTGIEVAGQRADRREDRFWVTYWHPLRGPAGNIVGINVAAEEITERKRAEAALLLNERELRTARDTAEAALEHLRSTQQSLIEAEKLAALGRLVAGVAHEISTPVGNGLTVASSLEQKAVSFAAEVARGGTLRRSSLDEFLRAAQEAALQLVGNLDRVAKLVRTFKEVAVDRSYHERSSFDVGELTAQVMEGLRPSLQRRMIELRVTCQPDLLMNSFPGPYGQVLTNLFLNAVTHAFPDGMAGTIGVEVREFGNEHVQVAFYDDGCGMTDDVRRKAFDPFFTTRRDRGCTGLGLHIVHNVVTNHLSGRLVLDSQPGRGTNIQVILPVSASSPADGL
jgi:PAS domain S-box-containing protein